MTRLTTLVCAALLGGCGGGEDPDDELPGVDCSAKVPSYTEVEVFQVEGNSCAQCHTKERSGSERQTAAGQVPSAINTDDYASAARFAELIVTQVYQGRMPPPGLGYTITEAQKQQVYQWGLCGTPE